MKEKNRNEKYAEKWFAKNGFECEMLKQYNSKTVYRVSRDGLSYKWELPYGVMNMDAYMTLCAQTHEMKKVAEMEMAYGEYLND